MALSFKRIQSNITRDGIKRVSGRRRLPVVDYFVYPMFTYIITPNIRIYVENNNRIHAASGAFGGLWKRVWSHYGIRVSTKCKVYKAIVLPSLLYLA